jgi:flagellar motor switch protein FliN/FliY
MSTDTTTDVRPAEMPEIDATPTARANGNINLVMGVEIDISVEIGRTRMPIRDLVDLAPGAVVELAKLAGEPADVYANGRRIASGEIVVVDENFGVRITEVAPAAERAALV